MAISSKGGDPPRVEDQDLVSAALAGDRQACGALYDRYAPLIRAICFDRTGDVSQSEDLCQDVFLKAHEKLAQLRDRRKFGAWLIAITRLTCRDWLRRSRRRNLRRADVDLALVPQDDPDEAGCNDGLAQLHEWLLRLPDKERLAIQVCCLLEEPPERARGILNLSRSGLYAVLERAKKRLKRLATASGRMISHE
ncbi:MAG: sigma-70 family RNA polymerase sigma factor [Phycisphaerae bacterium]|jgi:RNA polymerase sigma-70 factor (ECF subfamily)